MSEFDKMERWANGARSEGRALISRPNFTIPNGPPAVEPTLRLGGPTPGTAVVPSTAPNFTIPRTGPDVLGESRGGRFASTNGAAVDAAVKPSIRDPGPGNPYAGKPAFVPPPPVQGGQAAAAAAKPVSGIRNFFTGGAPGGVGGAFKSVGGAAAGAAGSVARGAAKLAGPVAALGAIYDGFTTDTQDYEQRLGLSGRTIEGTDVYGRDNRLGADLNARMLGIAGDVAGASGATTEAYRKRYGNETTDPSLLGDVFNRTVGVGEDVVRQWSGNDALNRLTGGAIGFDPRNDAQPSLRAPRVPTSPSGRAAAYNFVDTAGQGRGRVNPSPVDPNAAPPTNGLVSTLAPDLPEGMRKLQQGGKTLYTNVAGDNAGMFKPGTISAQNSAAADALSARYGAEARATAQAQIDGAKPQGLRARLAQQLDGKELTAKGVAALARAEELDNAREDRATTNAITLRGQDMTAGTARMQAKQQQAQQDRAYGLDREKFALTSKEAAAKMTDAERTASAAADKNVQAGLEARYRTTDKNGNSVPDHSKIAEFRTALDTTIPQMVKKLQEVGTPAALAKANDLIKHKAGALEPGDFADLHQLFDLRARAEQAKGMGPNQGSFKYSDNLFDYRQRRQGGVEQRTFGGNRVVMENGTSLSANDLAYRDGPANAILPDFLKTRSNDLTRGLRTN